MKVTQKQMYCYLIAALLISSPLVSCADNTQSEIVSTGVKNTAEQEIETEAITETSDHRFDDVNFEGRAFRAYASADSYDSTNAYALIAGEKEMNGDIVNDTVLKRNQKVSDLLNIKLEFTPADLTYKTAISSLRKMIMAGDDLYDVIINDLSSVAPLSLEGLFCNIIDEKNFDFSRSYWYTGVMEDVVFVPGHQYIMAGDWFMDVLASCHTLYVNKDMTRNLYDSADYVYDMVMDGTWTIDRMLEMNRTVYSDTNGNGQQDDGDLFGVRFVGTWGTVTPFSIGSGVPMIEHTEDGISLAINNESSVKLLEKLYEMFYGEGALTLGSVSAEDISQYLRDQFTSQKTLFLTYNRLGDLAKLRDISFDFSVVPYPKLEESGTYITSMHDTSEIGAIPITAPDLNFASTCIEVLNRETAAILTPVYYEDALKVKYTTDTNSAAMIDLIHSNFGTAFPLAYGGQINQILTFCFCDALSRKSKDFASVYQKKEKRALKMIDEILEMGDSLP